MYQVAPQSQWAPGFLVARAANGGGRELLDTRGAFLLHTADGVWIWKVCLCALFGLLGVFLFCFGGGQKHWHGWLCAYCCHCGAHALTDHHTNQRLVGSRNQDAPTRHHVSLQNPLHRDPSAHRQ